MLVSRYSFMCAKPIRNPLAQANYFRQHISAASEGGGMGGFEQVVHNAQETRAGMRVEQALMANGQRRGKVSRPTLWMGLHAANAKVQAQRKLNQAEYDTVAHYFAAQLIASRIMVWVDRARASKRVGEQGQPPCGDSSVVRTADLVPLLATAAATAAATANDSAPPVASRVSAALLRARRARAAAVAAAPVGTPAAALGLSPPRTVLSRMGRMMLTPRLTPRVTPRATPRKGTPRRVDTEL